MINRFSLRTIVSALALSSALADVNMKTAVVDMTQLTQEYYKTKLLLKKIEEEKSVVVTALAEKQKPIAEMQSKLSSLKSEMEVPSINDEKRRKLFDQHKQLFSELNQIEKQFSEMLGRKQRAFTEKHKVELEQLGKEIHKIVAEHAKDQAYDYILNKTAESANGGLPIVTFSKDSVDITETILEIINKDDPSAAAPATSD